MQAVVLSVLCGALVGAVAMAIWAASRINEEGVRQFDRGFERGRWLTEVSAAADDGGAADRVASLLVTGQAPTLLVSTTAQRTPKELILTK